MSRPINNSDLFLWSLSLMGGADEFVDVEAVFLKQFELAPARLSWRTRPDLPDYKKCSKGLRDVEARHSELLVKTLDGHGRKLTIEGQGWVDHNRARILDVLDGGHPVDEPPARPSMRLLHRIERSDLFLEWLSSGVIDQERWRAADLLRCAPDSSESIWRERVESVRSAAERAGRPEVRAFIEELASMQRVAAASEERQ